MIIPTNIVSALLIVAFVVPGFVFVTVRAGLRGPGGVQDTQLSSRITLAVVVSVVFDSVYLVAAGVVLRPADVLTLTALEPVVLAQNPLLLGGLVLALGFVIPWLVGLIAYYRVDWRSPAGGRWPSWLRRPYRRGGYRNFPTAWDRAAPALGGSFVRVRTGDGKWIGGWYSSESFVGTYRTPAISSSSGSTTWAPTEPSGARSRGPGECGSRSVTTMSSNGSLRHS